MESEEPGSGNSSVLKTSILVVLILPDPCLTKPLDDGHATIEATVIDIREKTFALSIKWVKSTHYEGREVQKICVLSTSEKLRRDLDSLWVSTTDEEMVRVVRELENALHLQGLEVPS